MARQRMIHPDFFIDEDVAMLSPWARLLLISLLTQADREGRLEDKPARIALRAFPYDREVNVPGHIEELAEQHFILRYEVEGRKYIQIRNFLKFQKPHPQEKASMIPPPRGESPASRGDSQIVPGDFAGVGVGVVCRNTESESETEQSVAVDPTPAAEAPLSGSLEVELPELSVYGAAVMDVWHELRGSPFPQGSQRDFQQLSDWHGSGIPLRVVERGITDCIETMRKRGDKPVGKTLAYYNSAVRQAYGQWRRAIA